MNSESLNSRYAAYNSKEEFHDLKLNWEIDGYTVQNDSSTNVLYKSAAVEIPVKNIPDFSKLKKHGSLLYETTEHIDGEKVDQLWHLAESNGEHVLVQGKALKTFASNNRFSRVRLAGTDVGSFIEYSPIAKQIDLFKEKDCFYVKANVNVKELQDDIISNGFDVILIRE